ncbi:MAG: type II secretion system F family protein [Zetaproteobacteria bacterium]|nr:MAG: type II secretion system F family protein [Zetaproteobacteria bacterium]
MPRFVYQAISREGRAVRGEIEADSEYAARRQLLAQGLVPSALAPAHAPRAEAASRSQRMRLSRRDWTVFLQGFAALIAAGEPVAEALAALAEQEERARLRRFLQALHQRILEGQGLGQALAELGAPSEISRMIAAGEETGELVAVAEQLAEGLARRERLRAEAKAKLSYPLIVMLFGALVLVLMLVYVVPNVVRVFAHAHAELPWLTRAVIAASEAVKAYGLWGLAGMAAAGAGLRALLRRPRWRERSHRLLLRAPVIGRLVWGLEAARFCRTFGMLLAGGVEMLGALHIAAQSLSLVPLRRIAEAAREAVREGKALAPVLAPMLPPLAARMVRIGEASGRLDALLLKAAEHLEQETGLRLNRFVQLIEPMTVVLIAVGVGILAAAILLPLVQMSTLVR